MSILDKHPAPWTRNSDSIVVDANGAPIEFCDELERLGLAAPELLAALKEIVRLDEQCAIDLPHDMDGEQYKILDDARALIAQIEGGNG